MTSTVENQRVTGLLSAVPGIESSLMIQGQAQGLQLVESLPLQKTRSQYFLTCGVCYEFRACSDDGLNHPEIGEFFESIHF
jgi:hypothetical protein